VWREKEDLISIGAYQSGTDALLDSAIALRSEIDGFLRQLVDEFT
jgi:flagellar biosynthesis/type III secretory pathway ATPase